MSRTVRTKIASCLTASLMTSSPSDDGGETLSSGRSAAMLRSCLMTALRRGLFAACGARSNCCMGALRLRAEYAVLKRDWSLNLSLKMSKHFQVLQEYSKCHMPFFATGKPVDAL